MTAEVETKQFQAETRRVLDIVIHSLYTERDIFVRELVSNSADALEKFRHYSLVEKVAFDAHVPLEITIDCDDKKHILTIADTGIGMTKEELEENLGTIAHSGSKHFFEQLAEAAKKDVNLIGQFGVGFYSVFMAAKRVRVQSRTASGEEGWEWASDGEGSYTLSPCPGLHRGTKIIIELKDDAETYSSKFTIERIIQQYSAFIPFPVKVDGKKVNTVQAIWARSKGEVTDEEYNEFYKYIGNATDDPMYRLHFSADAPLSIQALLYVPQENFEVLGMGRMQPGVNLYCQKVLIDQHSENILPEWLRFLKGVVDSEDLPLNISRQSLQDNSLVVKLRRVLTKRIIKFFGEEADRNPEKYLEFWKIFGIFIMEAVTSDFEHREDLGKLLRFESSAGDPGHMISLDAYVNRMQDDQKNIYFINGPSREAIEKGPYVELFRKKGVEILYTLEPIDDFVLNHLGSYRDKPLVSADRADLDLPANDISQDETTAADMDGEKLSGEALTKFCAWLKETLGDQVQDVKPSVRLVDSPAMIVNVDGYMTSSMERLLKASGQHQAFGMGSKKDMEINPTSPLINKLASLSVKDEPFAKDLAWQMHDNAMLQAGLAVDPLQMVQRNYRILERAAGEETDKA